MPKGKKKHVELDSTAWRQRLIKHSQVQGFLHAAGLAALTAAIEPDADLNEIHGKLQFLRHWALGDNFDLVDKVSVATRLKSYGVEVDFRKASEPFFEARPDACRAVGFEGVSDKYRKRMRGVNK